MNYDAVRDTLKDGQIVFFNAVTWPQKIISIVTNGKFSHVGIILWMTDSTGHRRLMCIESSMGGARIVQLRAYLRRGMTIVDIGLDWSKCAETALEDTGLLHYSIPNLILIGLKTILINLKLPKLAKLIPRDKSGEVCSEFVSTLLVDFGYNIDTFVAPNQLFDILHLVPGYIRSLPIDPQDYVGEVV